MKFIAVYCSSNDVIHQDYFFTAKKLGKLMAQNNYQLVYGTGGVSLMGEVARSERAVPNY